jgi:hypothetical protein
MISAVEKLTNEKEWWIKCADAEICEGWEQELLGINWSDVTGLPYAEFTSGMSHAVRNPSPRCFMQLQDHLDWSF